MAKRVAEISVFVALAMIFSYIEAIIPFNFGIPGVKLGIANLVVVTALYKLDIKSALGISIVRILLMGLLFGNIMSLAYSLTGGLLSLAGMYFIKKIRYFSVVGVSIFGGVLHNIGQLFMAKIILQSNAIVYYFPVLLFSGILTGCIIGLISRKILSLKVSIN